MLWEQHVIEEVSCWGNAMRIAMYYNQDVRLEETPTPQIASGEIPTEMNFNEGA